MLCLPVSLHSASPHGGRADRHLLQVIHRQGISTSSKDPNCHSKGDGCVWAEVCALLSGIPAQSACVVCFTHTGLREQIATLTFQKLKHEQVKSTAIHYQRLVSRYHRWVEKKSRKREFQRVQRETDDQSVKITKSGSVTSARYLTGELCLYRHLIPILDRIGPNINKYCTVQATMTLFYIKHHMIQTNL